MKGLAFISAALICAEAALAQGGHGSHAAGNASVATVWDEFESSCGSVLTDPAAFVSAHPPTAPDGSPLVVRSPDNQVLVLYASGPGWTRTFELVGVPGELQILCQVYGGDHTLLEDTAAAKAAIAARADELRNFIAARSGAVLVGGPMLHGNAGQVPFGDDLAGHIYGVQTELAGKRRFVYAAVEVAGLNLVGLYAYTGAQDDSGAEETAVSVAEPASEASPSGASATMGAAVEACLRNYRTPDQALPALEAAGLRLTPGMDAGTWEFSGGGVHGIVVPGDQLYCSIQSGKVPLDAARVLGSDLAYSLFPDMVQPGAPEGGTGPCDGLSIFAPRQMIWLRYAQAGNSGECINDGTSAIIIN